MIWFWSRRWCRWVGFGLLLIYLKDPNLGRGLMQIIPKLVVGVIGLGLFLVMAWFLISFLGATAIGLVTRRFFPEAIASIQPLSELPAVTRNIVVLLVLAVAGMVIQALWWAIRRR